MLIFIFIFIFISFVITITAAVSTTPSHHTFKLPFLVPSPPFLEIKRFSVHYIWLLGTMPRNFPPKIKHNL